ncbi:(2Fe-2S)-binding protein [Aduncisulcus paluster]|uniref:(2Fe-2S)-binding protein n=1 Tax=Aduncisulcus paluster TaxID=2918883 RepID=A0ABQ5KQL1_9EUKA|nr:(2Fe-2S)-binding protein [Aduncisulcus paluster]
MGDRIDGVRSSLAARIAKDPAEVDLRVAASVAHLGVIARILAPTIATADTATPGPAIESITHCVLDETGVSDRVLWGNVGSAANSAAQLIAATRPDLTHAAREVANTYLRDPRIDDGALRAGPDFRRRSCCLIYQLTDDRSAVCGDCVLETKPARSG